MSPVPRPVARGETLVARIGDGDFGRMGLALWRAEGIDAGQVEVAAGERSGVAMACNEVPTECTAEAFCIARAAGVRTLLNPAPAAALSDALLASVDVMTPNQTELRAPAGLADDAPEATTAQALLRPGLRAAPGQPQPARLPSAGPASSGIAPSELAPSSPTWL